MNEQQNKDSDECLETEERGETKDCCGCSCNICLMQNTYYSPVEIYAIIDKEIEFAKYNPIMSEMILGMKRIRELL